MYLFGQMEQLLKDNHWNNDYIVDSTELSYIASLAGGDTSFVTGVEFAFQSISGFSV